MTIGQEMKVPEHAQAAVASSVKTLKNAEGAMEYHAMRRAEALSSIWATLQEAMPDIDFKSRIYRVVATEAGEVVVTDMGPHKAADPVLPKETEALMRMVASAAQEAEERRVAVEATAKRIADFVEAENAKGGAR